MKVYKDKKLKVSLFLLPTCVILVTLCVILSIFNIVIHKYISAVTSKEMDNELKEFDIAYSSYNKKYEYLDENGNEEFIIPINYIIIDDEYNLVFPNEPWESIREKNRTKAISSFLKDNSIVYKEGIINKVKIEGNTYYIKSKIYKGKYDGVFVSKDSEEKDYNYIVLLYANITPVQKFLDLLNKILILLMGLSGFMSILIIFHMAKKIDTSFHKLKSYIIKVGERGNLSELDNLVYTEFNDVAKTVQEMSKMISQVEESQKQFFQNASHELRTPLMSIQGYAEGIKSDVIKNKKRAAEIIIKESEKMSSLVNEILFLSKLEVYERNVNKELIDIKELIYDCSWNIKSIADKKMISIEHLLLKEKTFVYGDEGNLERAFLNILSNAVRYAKKKIKIICEKDGGDILIKIIDDGDGISKEDLPHVFERFYKGKGGNFGIGLSITNEIISQHNGEISVYSDLGNTEFNIRIPIHVKDFLE